MGTDPPAHHPGDHYHHHFDDAARWAKTFDDPARDAWQKPDEVVAALGLSDNANIADLGAGTGYFSMRLARRVPLGKVFAVDIEADMVRYLSERAGKEGLANVTAVQGASEDAHLPEPVDLVLVVDTYHHIAERVAYFSRLGASLRPGGKLAIVDFTRESPMGPPPEHRIPPEEVTRELGSAGFVPAGSHGFLPNQYFLIFQKR